MVDLPLGGDGHIPGRHGGGNGLIPAGKGVACFGRVGRGGNGRAVVLLNDDILPAVFRLKGDGVLVDLPLCRQGHILGRHGGGNGLIPAGKGIACFGRSSRRGDGRAVILGDGGNLAAASGIKGDSVLVELPFCRQGHGFGHGIGKVPFFFALVPADEGIALFSGVGRLVGRGVGTNLGCYFASTLRLEGDRIGPGDLSGDLGAGGLRKPAARRDKHAVGRLAFLLPGRTAGNGPGGHLEPAAGFHINTAAFTGRAAHDIAAPHEERTTGRHIDTAAGGVPYKACTCTASDGAALYLDGIFFGGGFICQLPQGAALIKHVNGIGIAVNQRQLAIFHDMDQVTAPAGCFQQVAVQIDGHRSTHCPIGGDLNIPGQADDRGIGSQCVVQLFRGGHFPEGGQLQGAFLLDIVIRQGTAVRQKLAAEIQVLLIRCDTVLVLDLLLDIIDAVAAFYLQRQRLLPPKVAAIHINWHGMGGGEQHGQGQQYG